MNKVTFPNQNLRPIYANLFGLAVLGLVTLGYGWNLVTNLTLAIPGTPHDHDVATMVWNTAWVHYALTNNADLLFSPAVFAPTGADLRLHTYGLLQGLIAFPLVGWLGVTGAYNFVVLLTLFLNGASLYFLVLKETANSFAALLAGVFVMLATPLLFPLTTGRPAFCSIWIVVAALLTVASLFEHPRWWKGLLLGFWLLCASFSDFQMVLYTALWLLLYVPYCFFRQVRQAKTFPPHPNPAGVLPSGEREHRHPPHPNPAGVLPPVEREHRYPPHPNPLPRGEREQNRVETRYARAYNLRALVYVGVGGVIFLIPFVWLFLPALSQTGGDGYPRPKLEDMQPYSFVWENFFNWNIIPYAFGYELLVCAILAVFVLRLKGGYLFWLGSGLFFTVLALGPYLQPTKIPLPFALLSLWSPLSQFRTPGRMTVPALIGFGVVAGLLLAQILPKIKIKWFVPLIISVAIGARLFFAFERDPFAVQIYPQYDFYHRLAADKEKYTLLEVPFGIRSGLDRIGQGGEVLQYYWQFHHKPLINGMIARVPLETFRFYRQNPALLFLSGEAVEADETRLRENLTAVISWSKSRYVILHRNLLDKAQFERIQAFLDQHPMLERYKVEQDLIVYRFSDRQ
jgi:hypothetical protein